MLKPDKSNDINELQSLNINSISVTFLVSKFVKSNDINELQFSTYIPFVLHFEY